MRTFSGQPAPRNNSTFKPGYSAAELMQQSRSQLLGEQHSLYTPSCIATIEEQQSQQESKGDQGRLLSLAEAVAPAIQDVVQGNYKLFSLSPYILIAIYDLQFKSELEVPVPGEDYLAVSFLVEGSMTFNTTSGRYEGHQSSLYLTSLGAGDRLTRHFDPGMRSQGVGMWVHRDILARQFGMEADRVAGRFKPLIEGRETCLMALPLTERMKVATKDMLCSSFSGWTEIQYLRSKVSELLCLVVDALYDSSEHLLREMSLTTGKSKAIGKLLATLNGNFVTPPSIDQLSKLTGLSRTVLCQTFKQVFGVTIYDYIRERRLDAARELLLTGNHSILEIAMQVGYENQSSFSRAYKTRYGLSPSTHLRDR